MPAHSPQVISPSPLWPPPRTPLFTGTGSYFSYLRVCLRACSETPGRRESALLHTFRNRVLSICLVNEVLCQANATVLNFPGNTAGWPCLTPSKLFGPAAPDLRYENVCDGSDLYYLYDLYPSKILKLPPKILKLPRGKNLIIPLLITPLLDLPSS